MSTLTKGVFVLSTSSTTLTLLSLLTFWGSTEAYANPTYAVTASTLAGNYSTPFGFGTEQSSLTGPQVSILEGVFDPALTGLSGIPAGVGIQVVLGGNCFGEGCGFNGVVGGVTYGEPRAGCRVKRFAPCNQQSV